MRELVKNNLGIDFIGRRALFGWISLITWVLAVVAIAVRGLNYSIDFTGGTEVQVHFAQSTSIAEVREALKPLGVGDDAIQPVGDAADNRFLFRTQGSSEARPEDVEAVKARLTEAFGPSWVQEFRLDSEVGSRASVQYGGDPVAMDRIEAALAGLPGISLQGSTEDNTFNVRLPGLAEGIRSALTAALGERGLEIERTDSVGPKVGSSLRAAGITSLVIANLLLLVYIAFRFDWAFAPGAIICLVHDSFLIVGWWALTGQEFGLTMISAILTLIGYSINDTIVVYDRIRENMEKYRRADFGQLINDSLNQTLSRTVITSAGVVLALIPFLFLGGPVLFQFAQAMLIGIVIGTYSSVYVAAPLTLIFEEQRPRLAKLFGGGGAKPPAAGGAKA